MKNEEHKYDRTNILGIEMHRISFDDTVDWIMRRVEEGGPVFAVTPNVDHTNHYRKSADYRGLIQEAHLVVADGVPLLWAAKLLGAPLKGRVNGTDLFEAVARECALAGRSVFLMGGLPGVAETCGDILRNTSPDLKIAGAYSPAKGYLNDEQECARMVEAVKAAAPDVLFVGLPGPGAEVWIHRHYKKCGVPVSINVGASFDFVSGNVKRAPAVFQKTGMEWFYRLVSQPKKLWRRYVLGNPVFLARLFWQLLTNRQRKK